MLNEYRPARPVTEQDRRRAIHMDHGRTVAVVVVECGKCFRNERCKGEHSEPDHVLARKHFPGWKIKGVRGAKITRCPTCK